MKTPLRLIINPQLAFFGPSCKLDVYSTYLLDINFTGKTYKWAFKRKLWKLVFNRAHPTWLFSNSFLKFKRFSKTKIRLFLNTYKTKYFLQNLLYRTRIYNIFTQRGIKIKGGLFFKKRGKISTYRKMFNFWFVLYISLAIWSLLLIIKLKSPYYIFLISEFNWILLITAVLYASTVLNDPRFYILVYLFLFIAATEIVIYLLYLTIKNSIK